MRKRIKLNKKMILLIIIFLLLGYYIYYKNNNNYEKYEESSSIEELTIYEEEQEENLNNEQEVGKNTQEVGNNSEEDTSNSKEEIENTEMIMVHITGEVINWGVIELEKGSRIIDAVNKAGGFTAEADTSKVNLAYELSDGVKIYIPSKIEENVTYEVKYITENSGDNVITEESKMKETKSSLVNINSATQTELETLPGIGPSIALKIISYREENGNFSSVEDIKNVSGIGDNKFENIKELICV